MISLGKVQSVTNLSVVFGLVERMNVWSSSEVIQQVLRDVATVLRASGRTCYCSISICLASGRRILLANGRIGDSVADFVSLASGFEVVPWPKVALVSTRHLRQRSCWQALHSRLLRCSHVA